MMAFVFVSFINPIILEANLKHEDDNVPAGKQICSSVSAPPMLQHLTSELTKLQKRSI